MIVFDFFYSFEGQKNNFSGDAYKFVGFVRSGLSVSRQERFKCSCCEFRVAKIPGQWLNCYLFVVYQSPSMDDRVFDCLCEGMGSIQSVDPKSVFCFVGDFKFSTVTTQSGWDHASLMPMVWLLLILPLLLTVLNWLRGLTPFLTNFDHNYHFLFFG